jgi:cytidyltransferase-like protein
MKIVAVSGYFTVLHKGHIRLFKEAKKLGDKLVVIVNNNRQQIAKKGKLIHSDLDIARVIEAIKYVDEVVIASDGDKTVCKTLNHIKPDIFANGGDRTEENTPEKRICERNNIQMVFNIGGEKILSSSEILENGK